MMDHDALADLSGAYALDAVTTDEARAVEEHLAGCAVCGALVAEMRNTVRVLPFSCEIVDPSPALKRRILDIAEAERKAEARLRRNAKEIGGASDPARRSGGGALSGPWGAG